MTLSLPSPNTRTTTLDLDRWPDLAPPERTLAMQVKARVTRAIFTQAVRRLPIRVVTPDGCSIGAGDADSPLMRLHRPDDFFARVGARALIGFGESYQAGDWDCDDLAPFLTELCRELTTLVPQWMQRLRGFYLARRPSHEENTPTQTRGNIARHYDLSNDLFAEFLDETMTYSSGLFDRASDNDTLADSQRRKIDRLLDRSGVREGTRVLEIGTGWGELAIRAAARGARVHSVTLSSEQLQLAELRIAEAGYADRVEVELCDYRAVTGEYDAVLSVEMVEAVGHEYWATYFAKIDQLLAPGGIAAIQAITMPHDRMLATRGTWTWINKYIFPGGFLPSVRAIDEVTAEHTDLRVQEVFSMGPHYVRTLQAWDRRFAQAHDRLVELGFDEVFERMWHLYLCYSEAGFAAGYLDVNQLVLARSDRASSDLAGRAGR
ncbi:MAG: cyclopropane-fatty-acyl-phospholipid synthase family protein [Actinomycetota bacterium]|nr:cyclopropane-fatty-acyl-phospholipid synthase family protein [Actinomycetota bacterium]